MICSKCGSDRVEWKGPLVNLTHTECGECGGTNCQVVFVEHQEEVCEPGYGEGDKCNRDGCDGVIELNNKEICSCHIDPPCSACLNTNKICHKCGWDERED